MTVAARAIASLRAVSAGYGRSTVLENVTLEVQPQTIVSVVGPNGAGKTTMLKVLCGFLPSRTGGVELDGTNVSRLSVAQRARRGLVLCPEGRHLFSTLT